MSNINIGARIKKLRKLAGITQEKLADILGYSKAHISHIENNERTIGIKDVHKIAKIFNISYDELLAPIPTNHHFRSEKTIEGSEILDQEIWNDFKNFAKKSIKNKNNEV